MQQTNKPKPQKSRCTFCGSSDYGKNCRFGPHGTHFHPDNSTKCSYCGSPDYGKGCRLNPTSNIHVHGGMYNNMYKEFMQSFLDNAVLLRELKREYVDFECYRHGIIDQHGNKLKTPVTEEEQSAYTPFTKTILKLKKYLGPKIELMEAGNLLGKRSIPISEDINHYNKVLSYQNKVDGIVNELYKVLDEAQHDGLKLEEIKHILKA